MIPHRYPFLMVDKVIDIVPNVSAIGIKNVTSSEPYFQGHFPQLPIMPGVLIIESMAQTAGILVIETLGSKAEGKAVYFMSISDAKFRKPVIPGDTILIHVVKKHRHGNVWRFYGRACVGNNLVAEATYVAMIIDNK